MLVKGSILCQFVVNFDMKYLLLKKSEQAETPSTLRKAYVYFFLFLVVCLLFHSGVDINTHGLTQKL